MKKQIITLSMLVVGFLVGATALSTLADWTPPASGDIPPKCTAGKPGCDAPINVGGMLQYKSGILGLKNGVIENLTVSTGTPTIGQVLVAQNLVTNAAGTVVGATVGWGNAGGGAITAQSCPSGKFVTGFDAAGKIICDTNGVNKFSVNTDEQVLIHIRGLSAWITNTTRNGASLVSYSFADPVNGMPRDGKALTIYGLVSTLPTAAALPACPPGWYLGLPYAPMSDRMCIYQQPSAANGYETQVAIWDGAAGAHNWTFSLK